eukprot:m.320893 g.320893  ORF g.320893 m.320893 type:complete len:470 (-) comp16454_c0_seq31:45-1454(-)
MMATSKIERAGHCYLCHEASTTLLRCARCRNVFYCSKECQSRAWKYHKKVCMLLPPTTLDLVTEVVPSTVCDSTEESAVGMLPPEMLIEVLLRLPVLDGSWRLSACRLVCRQWYHQVRSPVVNRYIFHGRWALYGAGLLGPRQLHAPGDIWNPCLAMGMNGEVATGTEDRPGYSVKLWRDKTKPPTKLFANTNAQVDAVAILDGHVFCGGIDHKDQVVISVASVEDGVELPSIVIPPISGDGWLFDVGADHKRHRLFSLIRLHAESGFDETLDYFTADGKHVRRVFDREPGGNINIAVVADGRVLHVPGGGTNVVAWNPEDGTSEQFGAHPDGTNVRRIATAVDGTVATASANTVFLWTDGRPSAPIECSDVEGLTFAPGPVLITIGGDAGLGTENLQVWSCQTQTLLARVVLGPLLQAVSKRSVHQYHPADAAHTIAASRTGHVYTLGCGNLSNPVTDITEASLVLQW